MSIKFSFWSRGRGSSSWTLLYSAVGHVHRLTNVAWGGCRYSLWALCRSSPTLAIWYVTRPTMCCLKPVPLWWCGWWNPTHLDDIGSLKPSCIRIVICSLPWHATGKPNRIRHLRFVLFYWQNGMRTHFSSYLIGQARKYHGTSWTE